MEFKNSRDLTQKLTNAKALPQTIIVAGAQHEELESVYNIFLSKLKSLYPNLDMVSLNGTEIEPSVFHGELATIPMFDTGRLILIRHADPVLKKIDTNKTVLAYFKRDLANIFEKTHLLIQLETAKLPSYFTQDTKNTWILEQEKTRPRDIPEIIKTKVHNMGFEITEDAIAEMTNRYSLNPALIYQALDRLLLYCLNEKKIYKEDIHEVAHDVEGNLVFDIVDSLAERNIAKAVKLFQNNDFTNGVQFTSLINKFFTDLARYRHLKKCGLGTKEIHERLELNTKHSFIFRKNEERYNAGLKFYSADENIYILEKLFDLDKAMKENNDVKMQKNILVFFMVSLEKKAR